MKNTQRERAARLGAVLSHPVRLAILERLVEGPHIVSDLIEALGSPQPVISKHLAILRDAGLLACEADGRCRIYRLADAGAVDRTLSAFGALAATIPAGAPATGG
jgi:DNA-binding transcriptional ArsR family regulator